MRRTPSRGLLMVAHPVLLYDELSGPAIHLAGTRNGLRKRGYAAAIARSPLLERLAVGGASPVRRALVRFVGTILTPWVFAVMCIRSRSLPYIRHYHTLTALYWMLSLVRRPFAVEVNATLSEEPHALRRWPAPLLRLAESAEVASLRRAPSVVAVSGVLRESLVKRGLEPGRVVAVHNGCECEEFAEPAEQDPGTVVYVGSFRPWHRVELLLEALAEVPPDVLPRLVLAGPGDTERLRTTAVRLGVSERVSLPGEKERDGVARLMRSAEVLVLPNTADYGSPLKLFEYLASARPCVLPDLPNIREVVGNGESAFLFEPGNPKALAAAMETALTDSSAAAVGRRGRDLVCSRYTWSKNAERIVRALATRPSTTLEPGWPGAAARLRVLMAGPLPPPLGGATVAFASLVASLDSSRDVDLRTVDTSRIRGRGLRAPRAFVRMLRRAWGEMDGVDVVALHASATALHLAVPAFVWLARRRDVPLVVRRFGGSALEALGGLRRRAAVGGLRRADLFLVETRALVHDAEKAGLERVRQLPNSRPMPPLDEPAVPDGPCTRFVFVGHVRSEKGVLELIAAGEELEGDVVVDVFGTLGHDIDLLAFAGLSRVRYMGSLMPEDVHDTLCHYDCLVLPSYYEGEGHPGVILEAYAAGLPVVATRWRAIPELVDESTGVLIEPGDSEALRDAMRRLANDAGLCARLRKGVRERRMEFSDELWHERFVGYCRELAAPADVEVCARAPSGIGVYWRTVQHLKPRQLWTRALRRAVRPRVAAGPHPAVRAPSHRFSQPVQRADGWLAPDRVRLLNTERRFDSGVDWRPADTSRLWTYHLNYFDDLPQNAGRSDRAWMTDLVESWIGSNPVGTPDAWDPYPISLRAVNWVKWLLLLEGYGGSGDGGSDESGAAGDPAPSGEARERVLDNLALQVRYLEKRLEFDIMANHLFANATALVVAGFFFDGGEGNRWLSTGLALLARELREQVHEDGGHFERSPMYHAIVLEQVLDVINAWDTFPDAVSSRRAWLRDELVETARRMLEALEEMTHPDGETAFFHDSTLGVAATFAELRAYAERLGVALPSAERENVHWLVYTDFFRLTSDDGRTIVIYDAGGVKPRYQPGHAHCGSLSFELSRDGERLFVNSGVSTYEPEPERLRQRRTAAHNTVRIDGEEQSEVWGSHRCGRRAELSHAGRMNGGAVAAHDGYAFLSGTPTHERGVRLTDRHLEIADTFYGAGEHLLEWFFHLHPDIAVSTDDGTVELSRGGARVGRVLFPGEIDVFVEQSTYHPGFNLSVPNTRVRATWRGVLPAEFIIVVEWVRPQRTRSPSLSAPTVST